MARAVSRLSDAIAEQCTVKLALAGAFTFALTVWSLYAGIPQ